MDSQMSWRGLRMLRKRALIAIMMLNPILVISIELVQ
jgi:hypothetical protein